MTLSVIIPTLNEASQIGRTLSAVTALDDNIEVIVVDGGSSDSTVRIAQDHGAIVEICEPGRPRQMNMGAEKSSQDVLLFLHADTLPPAAAAKSIASALSNPAVAGGSFRLRFDSDHTVLGFFGWMSRFKTPLIHYGDSGYFVRRSIFFELGGFQEFPILEDLDFFTRLSKQHKIRIIQEPVVTSARRFLEKGVVKLQLLSIVIVGLYLLKVHPRRLRKLYDWCQ
jgi:rSAM/selenodomain-associated transferase 2